MGDLNPIKKRKIHEITRPKTNGISTWPNLIRSTDDLNNNNDTGSITSRCTCNGVAQYGGSRKNLVNVVQPQVNNDSTQGQGQLEIMRQRRVSWGLCDDCDDETVVKEISRHSNGLNGNMSFENIQLQHQQQCVDVYAHAQVGSQASLPEVRCQGRNCVSNVSTRRLNTQGSEAEILRKKCAEQQKTISFLLEKNKRRDRQLQKQRRSVSVTSLQASPLQRTEETCLKGLVPNISHTKIPAENIIKDQNDRFFIFPERRTAGVSQRRSRSCDFLLDDEEKDQFIIPPQETYTAPLASSGYERVTDKTGSDNSNDAENREHLQAAQRFNYCKGFAILLVVNAILICLNIIGIPFLVSERTGRREEVICINCESINYRYRDHFQTSNEKCCLDSISEMFELFANVSHEAESVPEKQRATRTLRELPMVQYEADGKVERDAVTRITWTKNRENPIQRVFSKLDETKTEIEIPLAGTYFIYSNVEFIIYNKTAKNSVQFGHLIVKHKREVLGNSTETCFSNNQEVRHRSHLSFLHTFTAGEKLHVNLKNENYFEPAGTRFGMFLLGKDTFQ